MELVGRLLRTRVASAAPLRATVSSERASQIERLYIRFIKSTTETKIWNIIVKQIK